LKTAVKPSRKTGAATAQRALDPAQIKQVLVNLIKNAMQAMSHGGVLTVQPVPARRGLGQHRRHGLRHTPDQLNRILNRFHHQKKGSGLGLMIVQRIVRDHGGLIKLETISAGNHLSHLAALARAAAALVGGALA